MDKAVFQTQKILYKYIQIAEYKLRRFWQGEYPNMIIYTGKWINENKNIVTAYISILPVGDVSGETLDLMLQLIVQGNRAEFLADVSKSNGELIYDLPTEEISYVTSGDLLSEVEHLSNRASEQLFQYISNNFNKILLSF
jgi:hypothetical protein